MLRVFTALILAVKFGASSILENQLIQILYIMSETNKYQFVQNVCKPIFLYASKSKQKSSHF
jgi:hypothetical protein